MTSASSTSERSRLSLGPRVTPVAAGFLRFVARADVYLILLGLGALAALASPSFLTAGNIGNLLTQSALLGILSIAQFLVVLIGGYDLSVAAIMALASVVLARLTGTGMPSLGIGPMWLPASATVAVAAGLTCGVANGLFVNVGRVQPLIATLAMMGIARGLAFTVSESSILVHDPLLARIAGFSSDTIVSVPVLVWLALAIAASWWCRGTRPGRHAYAVGGSEASARLAGVRADRIKLGIYGTSGLLSGIAGTVLVLRSQSGVPNVGVGWELDTIASIVIGGTKLFGGEGSLPKAMAGVLIYQMIANVMNLTGVDPFYQSMVRALVIILAVGLSVLRQSVGSRRAVQGRRP